MAKWVNKYPNSTGYEAETDARNALGKTVSLVLNPRTLHYDKGNGGVVLLAGAVTLVSNNINSKKNERNR